MSKHRKGWTVLEALVASACMLLGMGVLGFGFTGLYITVVPLLQQWWHWFSPLYLAVSEGSFAFAYLGWLLLTMRDEPPRRLVAGVLGYLGVFAAGSLALCAYASAGSFPDLLSHVVLCIAFFGAGIFAKVLVHRLAADPGRRELEQALDDARQYAIDVLRARAGWHWRYWGCPSLLRRQVTTGRLCDSVREDVRSRLATGRTSGWEGAVRDWVLGPDGLNLGARAEAAARKSAEAITRESAGVPPEVPLGVTPAVAGKPPRALPAAPVRGSAVKRVRKLGRRATDEDLLDAMREMDAEGRKPTKTRVRDELPAGDERAARLVAEYNRQLPVPLHPVRAQGMGE